MRRSEASKRAPAEGDAGAGRDESEEDRRFMMKELQRIGPATPGERKRGDTGRTAREIAVPRPRKP
jgi:hypothetical protein